MFSEYASRFLAQSQSRISSFRQPTDTGTETSRGTTDRQRQTSVGPSRFPISRSFLPRQAPGNPYPSTASQLSNFPFASRTSAAAPLFYSATDEFREEDDEVEREREVADFYALQRSRRHFGASQLEESSEVEDLGSRESDLDQPDSERAYHGRARRKRGGIRSSWRGGRVTAKGMARDADVVEEDGEDSNHEGESGKSSVAKGKMVDIGLDSSLKGSSTDGDHPPDDIAIEMPSDDPPAFQQFRNPPAPSTLFPGSATFVPYETDEEVAFERPRQPSSSASSAPPVVPDPTSTPRHDPFWASLFLICLAALFATFFLVFLHTSPPSKKRPLGDTIYSALRSSYHLLAVYTLVAVIVSLLWLSLIRSFVRPLTYVMLIGAPVVALSFSIYPLVASYNGRYHGSSGQDKAMRALSILPTVFAAFWLYGVYRGRHAFHKAIGILEWACRILVECPALLALGFATLAGVAIWTWVWLGMFTRVFLGGHVSPSRNLFIIDPGSWWLGASFVFMYLWTLAVGSGIQRATTAAAVSQWYFHRLAVPAPTSHQIVHAALMHATTTQLGTVCLSTLLTLLVRLPLLLLPRRATAFLSLFTHSLLPSSVAALTNPLTLTHAAIHSEPLAISARKLSQLTFLAPAAPTSSLHPRAFSRAPASSTSSAPLLPYRLAKLLLHTTRFVMALALGFGGWVSTARGLPVVATSSAAATAAAGTVRGSLYAYVVGLVAAAIGWAVLGAMEGVLGGVLDATVVCWAHDRAQGAAGGHCLEANYLFGDTR